jgi:hypothetical protein
VEVRLQVQQLNQHKIQVFLPQQILEIVEDFILQVPVLVMRQQEEEALEVKALILHLNGTAGVMVVQDIHGQEPEAPMQEVEVEEYIIV